MQAAAQYGGFCALFSGEFSEGPLIEFYGIDDPWTNLPLHQDSPNDAKDKKQMLVDDTNAEMTRKMVEREAYLPNEFTLEHPQISWPSEFEVRDTSNAGKMLIGWRKGSFSVAVKCLCGRFVMIQGHYHESENKACECGRVLTATPKIEVEIPEDSPAPAVASINATSPAEAGE